MTTESRWLSCRVLGSTQKCNALLVVKLTRFTYLVDLSNKGAFILRWAMLRLEKWINTSHLFLQCTETSCLWRTNVASQGGERDTCHCSTWCTLYVLITHGAMTQAYCVTCSTTRKQRAICSMYIHSYIPWNAFVYSCRCIYSAIYSLYLCLSGRCTTALDMRLYIYIYTFVINAPPVCKCSHSRLCDITKRL